MYFSINFVIRTGMDQPTRGGGGLLADPNGRNAGPAYGGGIAAGPAYGNSGGGPAYGGIFNLIFVRI